MTIFGGNADMTVAENYLHDKFVFKKQREDSGKNRKIGN